ncbi:hypothetical protein Cri9333_0449 [Crinalium epipsammum PCC 9333]|uniref:Uncharacterized protein n=1 Tax=Crinalium epipsammum PCC 9333 TaxID=1173022 RepID=K9VV93_9CYAN|nr:hypothetical protein Cri9333_0449 [Crinalium epipsammum PCC 9333]
MLRQTEEERATNLSINTCQAGETEGSSEATKWKNKQKLRYFFIE